MRKSLLKTPHSALSSSPVPGLVAVGARSRAKRNGRTPYTGVPRLRVAVEETGDRTEVAQLAARLRLLEGFVSRTDIGECTQFALQWLGDVVGVAQAICLVRPVGEQSLLVVGACGLIGSAVTSYSVSLEDWSNPLVTSLANSRHTFFPSAHSAADRKRRPSTPFENK